MFRLKQALTPLDFLSGHFAPVFGRSERALTPIPIPVDYSDVPQRLSSRRRRSRVTVQINGV